ncbi:hypothetical protein [Pseudogracilibacillus sp. SO30301A]|uniref:hypothetical protein n=1 Tax=Pseudogracilibacillus sp. SO30301A TaxID=3098291 RepID=UPI00300E14FC
MKSSEILQFGKSGLKTLLASIVFFYSHLSLILIALIPSLIRAFQMLNDQSPIWLEVIVELTRLLLILVMICMMSKQSIKNIGDKEYWNRLGKQCSLHFKRNWPYHFTAQIIVFIVLLFGLGNLLIKIIVSGSLTPMIEILGFKSFGYKESYNAYLFFLKNMTVIPLAIVFILKMCGIKPTNN